MPARLTALLASRGGHFEMESRYHADRWFDLDRLFAARAPLQPFAETLAHRLAAHGVEAVCGPMTGGAQLAAMIGAALGLDAFAAERFAPADAPGLFPVKYFVASPQHEKLRGRRVAIVDDAISAGSALRATHADLLACGAQPVALGALFVFGDAAAPFAAAQNLPLEAIVRLPFHLWPPAECPLCRAGIALEKVSAA